MSLKKKTKNIYVLRTIGDIPTLASMNTNIQSSVQRLVLNATYTFRDEIKYIELVH